MAGRSENHEGREGSMRFRFQIVDLMILVIPAAAFSYAMSQDPKLVPHLAFTSFLVLLGLATLGARFTRGNKPYKVFWKGVAVFGWIYLVFGLYFGMIAQDDYILLSRSLVGITFGLLAGYLTRRLVPRTRPHLAARSVATAPPGDPND